MRLGNLGDIVWYTQILIAYAVMVTIIIMLRKATFIFPVVPDVKKIEHGMNFTLFNNLLKWSHALTHTEGNHENSDKNEKKLPSNYTAPKWMRKLRDRKNITGKYFLTEILKVRIYEHDKAKWTIKELKQWLHYMFWAGVEHVYLCDHYENQTESVDKQLRKYIDLNLITYVPFSEPRIPIKAQVKCYESIVAKYREKTEWQLNIDMDEYPFIHNVLTSLSHLSLLYQKKLNTYPTSQQDLASTIASTSSSSCSSSSSKH